MTQQYFQVGEEVILESVSRPDLNCETVVVDVFHPGDKVFETKDIIWWNKTDSPQYFLACDSMARKEGAQVWNQSALRKKHTPGEDFQSLISSLNNDKVAS